jgi:hypothetical protein
MAEAGRRARVNKEVDMALITLTHPIGCDLDVTWVPLPPTFRAFYDALKPTDRCRRRMPKDRRVRRAGDRCNVIRARLSGRGNGGKQ